MPELIVNTDGYTTPTGLARMGDTVSVDDAEATRLATHTVRHQYPPAAGQRTPQVRDEPVLIAEADLDDMARARIATAQAALNTGTVAATPAGVVLLPPLGSDTHTPEQVTDEMQSAQQQGGGNGANGAATGPVEDMTASQITRLLADDPSRVDEVAAAEATRDTPRSRVTAAIDRARATQAATSESTPDSGDGGGLLGDDDASNEG